MKILLVCIAIILVSSSFVFAQKPIIKQQDSIIDQTDFKHNKQYFLDHYGTDDSTKALINTFFRVRRTAVVEVALGVVAGSGLLFLASRASGNKDNYGVVFIVILAFPIVPAAIVGIGEGTVTHLIYTRKKLLRIIFNYWQGKHLPRRFTHRIRYRQEFKKVKGIKPSIWDILFYNPIF